MSNTYFLWAISRQTRKKSLPILLELPVRVSMLLHCPRTHHCASLSFLLTSYLLLLLIARNETKRKKTKVFAGTNWVSLFSPLIKILFSGCYEESALLHLVEILTFFICILFSFTRPLQTVSCFSVNISTKRKPLFNLFQTCPSFTDLSLKHKSSARNVSTYKGSFYINSLIFCLSGEPQESNKGKENIKRHSCSHTAFYQGRLQVLLSSHPLQELPRHSLFSGSSFRLATCQ